MPAIKLLVSTYFFGCLYESTLHSTVSLTFVYFLCSMTNIGMALLYRLMSWGFAKERKHRISWKSFGIRLWKRHCCVAFRVLAVCRTSTPRTYRTFNMEFQLKLFQYFTNSSICKQPILMFRWLCTRFYIYILGKWCFTR